MGFIRGHGDFAEDLERILRPGSGTWVFQMIVWYGRVEKLAQVRRARFSKTWMLQRILRHCKNVTSRLHCVPGVCSMVALGFNECPFFERYCHCLSSIIHYRIFAASFFVILSVARAFLADRRWNWTLIKTSRCRPHA